MIRSMGVKTPVTELLSLLNEPDEFTGEIETYHKYTIEMDTLKKRSFCNAVKNEIIIIPINLKFGGGSKHIQNLGGGGGGCERGRGLA